MRASNRKSRHSLPALVLCALTLCTGCAAVIFGGAVAGGVVFSEGALETILDAPLDVSGYAVGQVMRQSEFAIISEKSDAGTGALVARDSAGKRLKIRLLALTPKATEIKIRVGSFGDEVRSRELLAAIEREIHGPRGSRNAPR